MFGGDELRAWVWLREQMARLPRPGLSPIGWVIAAYFGITLGELVMRAASSPGPPLTGPQGIALGLAVAVAFVGVVALVSLLLAGRR